MLPGGRGGDPCRICRAAAVLWKSFWLLWEDETLAAFVDGMVTDAADLTDAMYADASLHNENGAWQMIFGVNTLPEYRRRGLAGPIAGNGHCGGKTAGKKGPCAHLQGQLVHYYARFGFVNEGVSGSVHGGVTWYQMRLTF